MKTPRFSLRSLMLSSRPSAHARLTAVGLAAALLIGCASNSVQTPIPPEQALQQAGVPLQLPVAAGAPAEAPALAWQGFVREPRLVQLVTLALQNNRDLRVAMLNVQRAQAQLGLADANRLPTLGAGLNASRAPNSSGGQGTLVTAGLQVSGWEIDLFGRLASLSDAARAQLLASQAGQRAAELTLAATVVQTALALQADDELLALTRQTLASREQSVRLMALRESAGAASLLDLQVQQQQAGQARAALAQLTRQQAQDANLLALLLGQPVPPAATAITAATATTATTSTTSTTSTNATTAAGPPLASEAWLAEVPAGLSSAVLLRRPDVVQAEQAMRAAQANIAAARAAFWPSITLTGQAGQASSQLAGLFQGGNFAYTLAANALFTVFDAGRRQANMAAAVAAQQIAQAQYERAIQAAFRDTADGLAGLATWRDQLSAQVAQRAAARDVARLVALRTEQGAASMLEQLEAERSLFATEQAVLQVRLAELNNRVLLFKALGG